MKEDFCEEGKQLVKEFKENNNLTAHHTAMEHIWNCEQCEKAYTANEKNSIIIHYKDKDCEMKRGVFYINHGRDVTCVGLEPIDYTLLELDNSLHQEAKEPSKEENKMDEKEEKILELEERIDKRRIEILEEAIKIAERTGTGQHEYVVDPMNDQMMILANLDKLKRMFKQEFFTACGH